jgi:signal transduction histidine kinase
LGDSPARVRGDRTKLVQLVVNLLRNALEAFDRRGTDEARHLRVALDVSRGTGARGARLVVEDDGPGLPGGSGEALIEAGNSSKRDAGGLGLGHAREIARQHGGELTLENVEAGRGARATLFLPLHEEDDDA